MHAAVETPAPMFFQQLDAVQTVTDGVRSMQGADGTRQHTQASETQWVCNGLLTIQNGKNEQALFDIVAFKYYFHVENPQNNRRKPGWRCHEISEG